VDITTVASDLIVAHEGGREIRLTGLLPGSTHTIGDITVTTPQPPPGALLSRFATVNDVHFGEIECGRVDGMEGGPIVRTEPGEQPYPLTMNEGAASDIHAAGISTLIVKGDLSVDGRDEEWEMFERCYRDTFGDNLHVIRGNHDAYHGQDRYAGDALVELPGIAIALLDTVIPRQTTGTISAAQIDWLDALAAASTVSVIVMGHHQQWVDGTRSDTYFGLHPDASDALDAVAARRSSIVAYAAGHTHRHRVRRMRCGVPTIEVGCVKDFPGSWAEYRVHEGGIAQVVHRISSPDALSWSERCRGLMADFGFDYESYALGKLEDRCCNIPLR
jgi:predicted phosphodiesterase